MADTAFAWRRRWRALGFSVDRLVPTCFKVPAPKLSELPSKLQTTFTIPECGVHNVSDDDGLLVLDTLRFVMRYVAEHLPVQVVETDRKRTLPNAATALAVRKETGENDYLGSFDLVARVHALSAKPWKDFDGEEMALARSCQYVHAQC